jgi:hypothetical protein
VKPSPADPAQDSPRRMSNTGLAWVLGGVVVVIFLLALMLYRPA